MMIDRITFSAKSVEAVFGAEGVIGGNNFKCNVVCTYSNTGKGWTLTVRAAGKSREFPDIDPQNKILLGMLITETLEGFASDFR